MYFTLINDLRRSRVLRNAEDRRGTSFAAFWSTLTEEQLPGWWP